MELVRAVTNEELSPNYFINHLRSKINDFCWNITFKEFG
jgi:carboxypeptidase Taq